MESEQNAEGGSAEVENVEGDVNVAGGETPAEDPAEAPAGDDAGDDGEAA